MHEPLVEIGGITNTQRISRSQLSGGLVPVADFSSMEDFSRPGLTAVVTVLGGQLEALTATPIELA
jgi:hypothetical protein